MEKINAKELLKKFQDGQCSDEELALLENWYNQYSPASPKKLTDIEWAKNVYDILRFLDNSEKVQTRTIQPARIIAAACAVLCLYVGGYFLLNKPIREQATVARVHDINPGGNKATLTLSNGSQISLNDTQNGKLAQQGNTSIIKTADGQIVYNDKGKNAEGKITFNTTATPRGGQYHVVLSDGTNIWLNASSSVTYPTTFTGNNRTVEITGEAYFEVVHNAAKPFRVKSNGQVVEVLGTHFNINCYADEPVSKTTLLQGRIKIAAKNHSQLIKPGEQAIVSKNGVTVAQADVDQAVGWKNGDFNINDEDLQTVMRQVARWYDVEVIYNNKKNYEKFVGTISRTKKLSEILKALEMNQNVHFKTEGRRIEVMP
ncbi:MAG: anti-FecI sigma factor, FecR [Mucilaginibacter sp.]|nr:anti-FecI sigma factor, FecR [Mucilaginibacter sp.]